MKSYLIRNQLVFFEHPGASNNLGERLPPSWNHYRSRLPHRLWHWWSKCQNKIAGGASVVFALLFFSQKINPSLSFVPQPHPKYGTILVIDNVCSFVSLNQTILFIDNGQSDFRYLARAFRQLPVSTDWLLLRLFHCSQPLIDVCYFVLLKGLFSGIDDGFAVKLPILDGRLLYMTIKHNK